MPRLHRLQVSVEANTEAITDVVYRQGVGKTEICMQWDAACMYIRIPNR